VQAVVVAVGHVAERHAVEREAELVLVEATHGDARGPFVGAEGIGGLEVHAGQLFDRLERAGAGRQAVDLVCNDGLDLACFAASEHVDFFESGVVGCVQGRGL
jgi:hypothetical protein